MASNGLYGDFLGWLDTGQPNWNYTPPAFNPSGKSGKYLQQVQSLPGSSMGLRNTALASVLSQLYGPGLAGVSAAGGADQAVQGYRQGQTRGRSDLYSRGMQGSGAAPLLDRSLYNMYGSNIMDVESQAQQGEIARKMGLAGDLQSIINADLDMRNKVIGTNIERKQAEDMASNLSFNKTMGAIGNVLGLLMTGAGAYANYAGKGGLGNTGNWMPTTGAGQPGVNMSSMFPFTPDPTAISQVYGFGGGVW